MKNRLTVTIDADIAKLVERLAETRKTSVSAVIEDSLRSAPEMQLKQRRMKKSDKSFTQQWAGKLRLRTPTTPDPLLDALKAKYIQAGMEAEEKALKLREDYTDALTFKNLLLRSQSWLEKDVNKRNALTKEAEQLQAKVTEIMKRRSAAGQKPTGKTE